MDCDLIVLGGGPGGYSAAFRAADLGLTVKLVEPHARLGGVCLNVGCIPSKTLLHLAQVIEDSRALGACGIEMGPPRADLERIRMHTDSVIDRLARGLEHMAEARGIEVIRGYGRFLAPDRIGVFATADRNAADETADRTERFGACIIATGSSARRLDTLPADPRIVRSTGALSLPFVPERMLIVGGGIIGLEMATIYSALGAGVEVVEAGASVLPGVDQDLVRVWSKANSHRIDRIMAATQVVSAEAAGHINITFAGDAAPAEAQEYDLVLEAVGRAPNVHALDPHAAGVERDADDFILTDTNLRTSATHIFAIGDVRGGPMLAHKAIHEGHRAAEQVAGEIAGGDDTAVVPSVAYTDPEIAWAGQTETQARAAGTQVRTGVFPWAALGRALASDATGGVTKLVFDARTNRLVGAGVAGRHAGDLIGELTLALEMGADAYDLAHTIRPHPTFSESAAQAAAAGLGICTDLPPQRP